MFQSRADHILEIARELGPARLANTNGDISLRHISSVGRMSGGSLAFANRPLPEGNVMPCDALLITTEELAGDMTMPLLIVERPRLTFAYAAHRLIAQVALDITGPPTPVYADMKENVILGIGSTVGAGSRIGAGTRIGHSVIIGPNVTIGQNCVIGSNTVIGEAGFGVETFGDFQNVRIPHVGGVVIGDNVEIGALNSIASGTLDPTIIDDHVQTDNCVHIAHNCHIGKGTLITACAEISGSVRVGRGVWIGPNSSIMNGVSISDRALIGIGALVRKDCDPGMIYAGNPAKCLGERRD